MTSVSLFLPHTKTDIAGPPTAASIAANAVNARDLRRRIDRTRHAQTTHDPSRDRPGPVPNMTSVSFCLPHRTNDILPPPRERPRAVS